MWIFLMEDQKNMSVRSDSWVYRSRNQSAFPMYRIMFSAITDDLPFNDLLDSPGRMTPYHRGYGIAKHRIFIPCQQIAMAVYPPSPILISPSSVFTRNPSERTDLPSTKIVFSRSLKICRSRSATE
jgi:hypothetical protein